jgi:hypothetical protein
MPIFCFLASFYYYYLESKKKHCEFCNHEIKGFQRKMPVRLPQSCDQCGAIINADWFIRDTIQSLDPQITMALKVKQREITKETGAWLVCFIVNVLAVLVARVVPISEAFAKIIGIIFSIAFLYVIIKYTIPVDEKAVGI